MVRKTFVLATIAPANLKGYRQKGNLAIEFQKEAEI
jgi:hypothetical protein